jgi:serine/threonine-protein kinase
VAVRLFTRRAREPREVPPTEFMATVVSLPPDSIPGDSLPPDSLPPDSQPQDSLPPEGGPALDSRPVPLAAAESVATASNDHPAARARPLHIGRYEVRAKLGSGGLGQVFEGWDPLLSRTVAIKTLQFDASAAERVVLDRLFLEEARAVAKLSHPHIVTVHDAGSSQQGVWIAMERLQGQDLRQALAGGWRPSPARAAQLVRRVADALAYAHAHGVVHCDIKPANIHLNERGKPKVLDFGIARLMQENGAAADLPSSFGGSIAGSPHHLAPEQWSRGKIDPRTDLYALGTVFYELLAGRKAFDGDSVEQIRTAVELGHPAPPHELRTDVPPDLSAIAMKAMARTPADRWNTAQELAQALRRWLEQHRPVAAEPGTSGSPAAARGRAAPAAADLARPANASARFGGWIVGAVMAVVAVVVAAIVLRSAPLDTTATAPSIAPPAAQAVPPAAATNPASAALAAPPAVAEARPATPSVQPIPAAAGAAAGPNRNRARATAPPAVATVAEAPSPAAALGTVQLAISPWGEIEVDGQTRGVAPPLSRLELPAGSHRIVVRNSDFPPHVATVQVSADRPAVVRHRFAGTP